MFLLAQFLIIFRYLKLYWNCSRVLLSKKYWVIYKFWYKSSFILHMESYVFRILFLWNLWTNSVEYFISVWWQLARRSFHNAKLHICSWVYLFISWCTFFFKKETFFNIIYRFYSTRLKMYIFYLKFKRCFIQKNVLYRFNEKFLM